MTAGNANIIVSAFVLRRGLDHELRLLPPREATLALQASRQRLALQQLHGDERAALVHPIVEDLHDMRAVQGGRRAGFMQKTCCGLRRRREGAIHDLHGDVRAKVHGLGQPHGAHPAGVDLPDQAIALPKPLV
jgi:hypothetical protein